MADLTSVADVKKYLRINSATDDALIGSLVSSASKFIESWCGRSFSAADYVEKFNGTNRDYHFVKHTPLNSLVYVKVNNINEEVLNYNEEMIVISNTFKSGRINCEISYNAGYDVIPADIEQACIELVGIKYKQIETLNLSSKAIAGETTSFIVNEMPDFVKVVLQQYRSVNIF
ncbi:MAG: hypothetical protein QG564_1805 [Campylobacterota bacterium]|nr:hypothetical protein [Campylobacterota bacterium]